MLPIWDLLRSENELSDLFAKREEYTPEKVDKHGRFPYALSKYRNPLDAPVSRYLTTHGFKVRYPDKHKFAVCLTHDIDDISPNLIHTLASSLYSAKSFDFAQVNKQLLWKLCKKGASPYRNFRQIIELERKFNAKSTFYFMATKLDPIRSRYNIEGLEDDLKYIIENGWDIGLHIGYYSFDSIESIITEKKRLEKVLGSEVIGCRNHYLRFRVPDTWELLARAGFKYDSTFGYSEAMGFRNGICHPFNPINLNTHHQIDIMEVPLNIMDATFLTSFGLSLDYNKAKWQIEKMVDLVKENYGVLTILWHNGTFGNTYVEKLANLYEEILEYSREKDAWLTSADEIYRWFSENGYEKVSR